MPKQLKQVFLKPGRYHVGGGRFRDLTAGEIRDYVEGTKRLLAAGYSPPVLFAHAAKGSEDGAPKDAHDVRASRVRNGAGWLKDIAMGNDGSASYVLDITDSEAARKVSEGSIRFTSPELRAAEWIDGSGNVHSNFVAHVALTHKPRNVEQSSFREPAEQFSLIEQFSLDDWEPFEGGLVDEPYVTEGDLSPQEARQLNDELERKAPRIFGRRRV